MGLFYKYNIFTFKSKKNILYQSCFILAYITRKKPPFFLKEAKVD